MTPLDGLRFAWDALRGFRLRSLLMVLAMAVGVAAVVLLTALGEAARSYVTDQFASLGTNLLIVLPGRTETAGAGLSLVAGATPRDLTLADAQALTRSSLVKRIAPVNVGSAMVSVGGLERESVVLGSSADMLGIRNWQMAQGQFLPAADLDRAQPVCVLGRKLQDELFGAQPPVGRWLRLGDRRFRVIGILQSEGQSIGVDTDEVVIVPVASAQALFNTDTLFRILVEAASRDELPQTRDAVLSILKKRHQGEEDVTVITQDAVLATFDRIFQALTLTVAGIAGISLAVAGILVMNVMLVAVSQRTAEIGLLKAIGAGPAAIQRLFIGEAALLSLLGAGLGLALGQLGSMLLDRLFPQLSFQAPAWAVLAGLGVALVTGLLFGILPARRAARLDPVQALARR